MPSHPSIRLWEDSRQALVSEGTALAPPLHFTPKSRFLAGAEMPFCESPQPLRCLYFLGDGSASKLTIEPLSSAEALIELVKHSFLLDVEEQPRLASHFRQTSELAARRIHFRLDYPRRYDYLPQVRQGILEHAQDVARLEESHAASEPSADR